MANVSDYKSLGEGFGLRPICAMPSDAAGEYKALKANARNDADKRREALRMYWHYVQCNEAGYVQYQHPRIDGLKVNSLLRKDEWEELDTAVVEEAHDRVNMVSRLRALGLVKPIRSMGVLVSQWNTITEVRRPTVSVEGITKSDMDLVDYNLNGVTIPVTHERFDISTRHQEASRLLGAGVDTDTAREVTRAVVEEWERMLISGSTVNVNLNIIYGLTNEPNINTGSASGDFGTISNIYSTFLAMVGALSTAKHHGPFECWVAQAQYIEMLNVYTDGSGETALDRVLRIPQIRAVWPSDFMTAGTLLMVQMDRNTVDFAITRDAQLVEWMSPDGMMGHFKVIAVGAPRVKSTYASRSGVAYYTGA